MKKTGLIFLLVSSCIGITFSQVIPDSEAYLGQTPPGKIRKIFNLATDPGYQAVENIAISPDGKEIYYEETNSSWTSYKFKYYKYINNRWDGPLNLFNDFYCLSLSPDGKFLYFENDSYSDCWISGRQGTTWNPPSRFLRNFNVHSLRVTNPGNYFLSSNPTGGLGQRDICKLIIGNSDTTLLGLGLPLNSSANEGDFFISNDESFIIFMSNRSGGIGVADLYLSFRKSNDTWTNPKNLGASVNTTGNDFGPYVTADTKYLFYTSAIRADYSDANVFWVRIDNLIDSLKQTNSLPYLKTKLKNQTGKVGEAFSYTIPDSTFIDDDGNNTLAYNVSSRLPAWLNFDPEKGSFTGIPTEAGNISITVKAIDSVGASASTSFTLIVGNSSSSLNQHFQQSIRLFPNPAKDKIHIFFGTANYSIAKVLITDRMGKQIYFGNIQRSTTATIDLPGNPAGLYFLKLDIDGEIINKKIILE
jgi:hypothetical protein